MIENGVEMTNDFIRNLQIELIQTNVIKKIKDLECVNVPEGLESLLIATVGLIVYSQMDKKFIRTILKGLKKSIKETKVAYDTIKDNEFKPVQQEKVEIK